MKFRKPNLEALEDRITPADLWWRPGFFNPNGPYNYSLNTNWSTQQGVAMAPNNPPGNGDVIHFDPGPGAADNPGNYDCYITNSSAACAAVQVEANWASATGIPHALILDGGALNIWEQNDTNAAGSHFNSAAAPNLGGVLNSVNHPSFLRVIGSTNGSSLDYKGITLNNAVNKNIAQLDVYVYSGGVVNVSGACTTYDANFHVGTNDQGDVSAGTVTFATPQQITAMVVASSDVVAVSSQGTFNVLRTTFRNALVNSAGTVDLDNATVNTQIFQGFVITGGELLIGNTSTATINLNAGGVSIANATLVMGTASNQYSTLKIVGGDLTMTNVVMQIDIDCSSQTECDTIMVLQSGGLGGHININQGCTLQYFNWNVDRLAPGAHDYAVLWSNLQNGLSGILAPPINQLGVGPTWSRIMESTSSPPDSSWDLIGP